MKKNKQVTQDVEAEWIDDVLVPVENSTRKKKRQLTDKSKMIKFLSAKGQ